MLFLLRHQLFNPIFESDRMRRFPCWRGHHNVETIIMVTTLDLASSARWSSGMIRALDCSAYDCARPRFRIPVGPGRHRRRVVNFWSTDMHCVHFARSWTFLDLRAQYSTTTEEIRSGPEDRPYNAIAHLLYYPDILYLSSQLLFLSLTFCGFSSDIHPARLVRSQVARW